MAKSPELITASLPRWLAYHGFDQNSLSYALYGSTREEAFEYLLSFATEHVLEKALAIVKSNEHFMVDSNVYCCNSEDSSVDDLIKKLEYLLVFVRDRNALLSDTLTSWPTVLISIVKDYLGASQ